MHDIEFFSKTLPILNTVHIRVSLADTFIAFAERFEN
jgi:hypothetical protein